MGCIFNSPQQRAIGIERRNAAGFAALQAGDYAALEYHAESTWHHYVGPCGCKVCTQGMDIPE